jgi:hypothetical protein
MKVTQRKGQLKWVMVVVVIALSQGSLVGAQAAESESKLEIYGTGQADYVQDYRRVDPAWDDTLRPSKIPTSPGTFGTDVQSIISARQSRFGAKGSVPVQDKSLKTQFEFDLFGVGVDEGQTTIRLRHAYGQWGSWLGGQTHSLFMDVDVFPNVIDYWGPAGMSFFRLPQIRWTPVESANFRFAIAIEKPSEDIDPGKIRELSPELGENIQGDEKVPDLTAQARIDGDFGHVQLAGMLRRIGYETLGTPDNGPKGFAVGWGFDLTSSIKYGEKSKVHLSALYGQGIATYMNDGGNDLAPEFDSDGLGPKAIPLFGLMAYVDHYWAERWSTTAGYSRTQVVNTSLQSSSAFHSGEYASINLVYAPDPKLLFGGELLWGRRTDHDGATGNDIRSQITLKYSFSNKL